MEFSMSDHGQIVMMAPLTERGYIPSPDTVVNGAFITGTSHLDLELVAVQGDPAPDVPGGFVFGISTLKRPAINNAGQLTVYFRVEGPGVDRTNDQAIWMGTSGEDLRLVIREGDPAPDTEPGTVFTGSPGVRLGEGGRVLLSAGLAGPSAPGGLWMGTSADDLNRIVQWGAPDPDGEPINTGNQQMNNAGQIVSGSMFSGAWFYDPDEGVRSIVRVGDVLEVAPGDFRTLSYVYRSEEYSGGQDGVRRSFNDAGQLVFLGRFTDGTRGIFLATIPGAIAPGDANRDGDVDDDDLSLLLANWGRDAGWEGGDSNGDDTVDDNDLSLLIANWSGAQPVPEPTALPLLLLGALAVLRRASGRFRRSRLCLPRTPSSLVAKELRFLPATRFRRGRQARVKRQGRGDGHLPGIDPVPSSSRLLSRRFSRCERRQLAPAPAAVRSVFGRKAAGLAHSPPERSPHGLGRRSGNLFRIRWLRENPEATEVGGPAQGDPSWAERNDHEWCVGRVIQAVPHCPCFSYLFRDLRGSSALGRAEI